MTPNISVEANIWCSPDIVEPVGSPEFLKTKIPGDLLVHFLGTRDSRFIDQELTRRQLEEYKQSRFFQHHGQVGYAFENL